MTVPRSHGPTLILLAVVAVALLVLGWQALHEDGDHSRAPGYSGARGAPGMKDAGRIFYVHVPSAVTAMLAFTVTLVGSIAFLVGRRSSFDRWALSAAEIGILFTTIVLVTGSIWARAAWGSWWVWDEPRLLTSLILWFIYVGYLLVRSYARDREQGARFAAVVGIIGYLAIPMVYWAGNKGAFHPKPETFSTTDEIRGVLFLGMGTVALLGVLLFLLRLRLGRMQERLAACEEALEDLEP
jgi:heme exporter protein C